MDAPATCSQCSAELPDDGKTRKRNRTRRCRKCNGEAAVKRRKEDPVKLLSHRLNNSLRRLYTDPPPSLWAPATVASIILRCNYQSVVSGETNMDLLCVFSFFKDTTRVPRPEHFVIVTSREAQSIAKCKTQEERSARFPQHIRDQMEQGE